MTKSKALYGVPPKHPLDSKSHSKRNCSDKSTLLPLVAIANKLSYWAVVEKAQHAPHCPWFLMEVTLSYDLQSKLEGDENKAALRRIGWEDNGKFNY